mmetsp:Transcript_12616/g.19410  ORF Transcript_12616/g.19410 Transcript_12616/m.19410 type:complete len:264 (+) Transcript_12616:119-910(+)|eukprot:CAMPEP_0178931278 /NCGR_PEP_ID=MMETSP0786-20121207/21821_1 /TAXON_ID=186022 /ORGANISM="Thalassionema frauenfeldii, Strain CCMP 1798" /LENGTH=263 /DNA_ID=CAMNT_0020608137 /DNA_START=37 /DNA_END=828 /DNA_ORIENTATION=+
MAGSDDNKVHVPSWMDESTPLMGSSGGNPFADDDDDNEAYTDTLNPLQSIGEGAAENSKNETTSSSLDWHSETSSTKRTQKSKTKGGLKVRLVRRPTKNRCLELFHWFEFLAVIPLLCLLAGQLIPVIFVPLEELGFVKTMIRCYLSLFTIILILVEIHAPIFFLKNAYLLRAFFPRGFLYTFLGVMEMEETHDEARTEIVNHAFVSLRIQWAPMFMHVTSWVVFVVGCIYMLFGIFCLQVLRDNLENRYKEKLQEYDNAETV